MRARIHDQDLIDKLIDAGIYPIKEKDIHYVWIRHTTGNLWRTEDEVGPKADFWQLMIGWKIGILSIPNDPDPIIIPHIYRLEGETNRDLEPEGEYDENTDTWIVTFDTMFALIENTNESYDPTGDRENKIWEGPLKFTLEIQRIFPE